MVTKLDDARITLKLDVEGAKRDADRLEEELRAKDEGREKRREEDEGRRRGQKEKRGGGLVGAAAGSAALRGGFGRIARLVAIGGGLAAAVEFLAPAVAAFLSRSMENLIGEATLKVLRERFGIDPANWVETIAEEAARLVGEGFAEIQADLGAASDATAFARAQALLGPGADRSEAADFFLLMRQVRKARQIGERKQARVDRENFGETLADVLTGGIGN